jgi:hypothetical protein
VSPRARSVARSPWRRMASGIDDAFDIDAFVEEMRAAE